MGIIHSFQKLHKPVLIVLISWLQLTSCEKNEVEIETPEEEPLVEKIIQNIKTPSDSMVLVAAHRGDWLNYPENSLAAIQGCIDMGIDIVEIDIRITKDNHLILLHDQSLERTTTGTGKVYYYTLEQLKQFYLKDRFGNVTTEQIPTLQEALEVAKDKIVVTIDKHENLEDDIIEIVREAKMLNQSLIIGFEDYSTTKQLYHSALDSIFYTPAVHKTIQDIDSYVDEFTSMLSPSIFAFWYSSSDSESFNKIPSVKKESRVWVSTTDANQCAGHTDEVSAIDPDAGWGWVIDNGANIIMTDTPEELLRYLKHKNLRRGI